MLTKKIEPNAIKAVLFDLGKVLLRFDFEPAFRRLAKKSASNAVEIREFFVSSGLEVLYDGGKISSHRFYLEVKRGLELRMTFRVLQCHNQRVFGFQQKQKFAAGSLAWV